MRTLRRKTLHSSIFHTLTMVQCARYIFTFLFILTFLRGGSYV